MQRYETLILAGTQITADELSTIENFFEKTTSESKGKVISFEKWGKYRLSYPVQKNDYGIYVLIRFEHNPEDSQKTFKSIDDFLKIKCNEIVMRHVTIKLDAQDSLEYKRPEPVDTGRTGGFDTFIKENKMEGFINSKVKTEDKKEEEPKTSPEASEDK